MEEHVYKKIKAISFGLLSPKLVKDMASAKIVTPELYDKEGYPVDGGLMDVRLGVIDPGLKCKTCGQKLKECPGHFGYISLARPVIHVSFISVVLDFLRCTCRECSEILIPKERMDQVRGQLEDAYKNGGFQAKTKKLKQIITTLRTVTKCPHCAAKQLKIKIEKPTTLLENEKRMTPVEIRTRLEKLNDDTVEMFGIDRAIRPEWMVLTILPIPPVTMRPSITLETGDRSEDDLTHKLGDIVRINQRLFENINAGAPEIIIEDLWDLLQYHVTTFYNNEVSQLPPARHRSGQPLKTITARIKSKEGRIRHNLAGKRTNFSARTVISPDPKIELNEVGIPKEVAQKLSVPERVTEWNQEYLKKFVERGPDKYPGANYIARPDGKRKKITDETREQLLEELQPGFIVERHVMDGDIAIFNRQPSLHRMSMMCHKIKVLPGKTFRLNPSVCAPYNADFDGDEMNIHIPQTEEARAEAEILMQVQTQLISPRYGLSIIGCIQDAISGNYVLTKYLNQMTKKEAVDLLAAIGFTDFSGLPNKDIVSGKEVFSVLLPEGFNFKGKTKQKEEVLIEKGVLKKGCMDKANLGEGAGLMLRNIIKEYGQDTGIIILGRIFRLGNAVLYKHGFSLYLSDTDLDVETKKKVDKLLNDSKKAVTELIKKRTDGKLEPLPGRQVEETFELFALDVLNKARNEIGKIVGQNAENSNPTLMMANSGARGGAIQIAQMSACVGQQAFRGGRITKGYKNRTLSYFKQHDLGSAAHGFIDTGFKGGLKPHEFFFMAMTGRDSLMDTALRTPKSGYLYRRLANALQDVKVCYDGTVRDSSQKIIQFEYGEDSIDVAKSRGGKLDIKKIIEENL